MKVRTTTAATRIAGLIGCWLMGVVTTAWSDTDFSKCPAVLSPYLAEYTSSYENIRLKGQRSLTQRDSGDWILSHRVKNLGSRISEYSVLENHDRTLRAREYAKEQSILGLKRNENVRFDWENQVIEVTGRRERSLPLDRTFFDSLSYQLALRCDMAQGAEIASYSVVRKGKVTRYRFRRVGSEQLDTALGIIDAVLIERVHEKPQRSTRIWLAPTLNFLIVRLERSEQQEGKQDLDVTLALKGVEFH